MYHNLATENNDFFPFISDTLLGDAQWTGFFFSLVVRGLTRPGRFSNESHVLPLDGVFLAAV